MKWLTINCDAPMPSFGVVEDGRRYGTLRMLDWREIPEFAKWIGVAGGRDMPGESNYESWGQGYRKDESGAYRIPNAPKLCVPFARAILAAAKGTT